MIQLAWKEAATRLANIESLEKLARALHSIESTEKTLVYFEFDSPKEVLWFCSAVKLVPNLKEIDELGEKKRALEVEIAELDAELMKKREKKMKRDAEL